MQKGGCDHDLYQQWYLTIQLCGLAMVIGKVMRNSPWCIYTIHLGYTLLKHTAKATWEATLFTHLRRTGNCSDVLCDQSPRPTLTVVSRMSGSGHPGRPVTAANQPQYASYRNGLATAYPGI